MFQLDLKDIDKLVKQKEQIVGERNIISREETAKGVNSVLWGKGKVQCA